MEFVILISSPSSACVCLRSESIITSGIISLTSSHYFMACIRMQEGCDYHHYMELVTVTGSIDGMSSCCVGRF